MTSSNRPKPGETWSHPSVYYVKIMGPFGDSMSVCEREGDNTRLLLMNDVMSKVFGAPSVPAGRMARCKAWIMRYLWPVKEHEILHLLKEWREEQRRELKKIMIAQATLDASLKGLTTAVDAAVAALAAGDTTTSTPDAAVSAYQAGVDAQTVRIATATPPPPAPAPAAK